MPATLPLLLEIGVEELPSSFVDAALVALPKIVADELANVRLSHGEVTALGTPRKLGIPAASLAVVEKPAGPKQKPGRYVIGRRVEKGRPAMNLLGEVLARV